jgi:hypothetical protein
MIKQYIQKSMSFSEYVALIDRLLLEGKTTGPMQTEGRFQFARLNRQRMRRLEKTIGLDPDIESVVANADLDMTWLVITEGWCGDAAQNVPIIEKVAAANPGIETRYLLRDEYPELMNEFLTNGTRSIPKLIAIDRRGGKVLGTWGPRPNAAQVYQCEMRDAGVEKELIGENMQRWYLADRGRSLQHELAGLISEWSRAELARAA